MECKYFEFNVVLNKINDTTENLEDHLYQAGCDDALISFRNDTVFLDFTRKAKTFNDAVISALSQIESSPLNTKVISVGPDNLVTEAEIAKRLNLKRQTVSLWIKGLRRKNFPKPLLKVAEASPLWRWREVVYWCINNKIIEDDRCYEEAVFIENLNLDLEERDLKINCIRKNIENNFSLINKNFSSNKEKLNYKEIFKIYFFNNKKIMKNFCNPSNYDGYLKIFFIKNKIKREYFIFEDAINYLSDEKKFFVDMIKNKKSPEIEVIENCDNKDILNNILKIFNICSKEVEKNYILDSHNFKEIVNFIDYKKFLYSNF